jgi:hypothetical protein
MPSTPAETLYRPTLTSLPLDLILDIADHLPASSVTCLSLTCKYLYYSHPLRYIWTKGLDPHANPAKCPHTDNPCYPGIKKCNREYFALVGMLKKDMPTHLHCGFCHKFHPKPTPKASRPGLEWVSCPTEPQDGMCISWPKFGVHLQFEDVQMVMNQYRWGGLHGAPLTSIAMNTDWTVIRNARDSPPFLCKLELKPRILDDSLAVHATQRLFFTQRQTHGSNARVDFVRESSNAFKVCKHHNGFADSIFTFIDSLFKDRNTLNSTPTWTSTKTSLQYCGTCATCFSLEATYHGNWASREPGSEGLDMPADGVELTMHSWILLGECEHIFYPLWLNIAEQREAESNPIYSDHIMLELRGMTFETFDRVMRSWIEEQWSQMSLCFEAIRHPSLLPAIDRAVALENDPHAAKHHELTNTLRAAGHRVDQFHMHWLVQMALTGRLGWCDESASSNWPEALRTALKILNQHKRNNAKARLKRLRSRVLAKLSCGGFEIPHSEWLLSPSSTVQLQ